MLPIGGLLIAVYTGWVMDRKQRSEEFRRGTTLGRVEPVWTFCLRLLSPAAVAAVLIQTMLKSLG